MSDEDQPDVYQPDHETIRRECEAIQATWTDEERQRRIVGGPTNREIARGVGVWEVPTVKDPNFSET